MATATGKNLSVITISITPFDAAGKLDETAFRKHLKRLGDAGLSVFLGGSGSGEGYTLTTEENERVLTIGIEELKGKVPVYADGVEPRTTSEMVAFVRRMEKFDLDAVRIMPLDPGHGAKPTPPEVQLYHERVLDATRKPMILTSHQAVGYVLSLDLVERLVDRYPHVRDINYGGNDVTYIAELIKRVGDRIQVHCAGCTNGLVTLALGGNGFMGNEGNFAPQVPAAVIAAFKAQDQQRLRESFGLLMSLAAVVRKYGGSTLRGMKPLLNAFGLPGGTLREPRLALEAAEIDKMIKAVLALRIPGLDRLPG